MNRCVAVTGCRIQLFVSGFNSSPGNVVTHRACVQLGCYEAYICSYCSWD